MKRTSIKDLSCGAVDMKPISFDWTTGYGETWEYYDPTRCEKCEKVLVTRGGEKHSDVDDDSDCDGYVPESEGPMMSYYYPLPETHTDAAEQAAKLDGLPLCVVEFTESGELVLALTGGGMDLSWEICEAFMRLGYLPPAHYADLPGMCGRGVSPRDRWIIAGCLKSCTVAANWMKRRAARLRETVKEAKEREAKKGAAA